MKRCILYVIFLMVDAYIIESYGRNRFNAALGRGSFTYQSSELERQGSTSKSFKAVDGNKATNILNLCTQTLAEDVNWWSVNLGELYLVYKVHVTSTDLRTPKLKKFSINYYREEDLELKANGYITWNRGVWWTDLVCNEQGGEQAPGTTQAYPCTTSPPVLARWIVVRQKTQSPVPLRLCEVEVEADKTCVTLSMPSTKGSVAYFLPEDRLQNIRRFFAEHRRGLMENPPHGTVVKFTCNPGYSLRNGAASALCKGDGTWNASLECQACQNGYFGLNCNTTCGHCKNNVACNFIDGSCAECQPGYELPTCLMGVDCGIPDPIDYGEVAVTQGSTFYQDAAWFQCIAGFVWGDEDAKNSAICQEDGTWSDIDQCTAVDCGDPPEPYNHVSVDPLMVTRTTLGGMAYYDCGTGYTSDDSLTRACQEDGTWSGGDVKCKPVDCGDPPVPINGSPDSSVTVVMAATTGGVTDHYFEAVYNCGTGFTSDDLLTRKCQRNGQWEGQTPRCSRRVCPILPHPAFGQVTLPSVNREYQSLASYSCISGFQLQGNSERQCDANGEWTNEEPVCREIDECASNPCGAHGQCTDEIDSYQCGCVQGYMGVNCMQVVDGCVVNNNPCSNQGTCYPQPGARYTCECVQGYTGDNCDIMLTCDDEMVSSNIFDIGGGINFYSASIDHVVQYKSRIIGSNLTYTCGTGWYTDDITVRYCVYDGDGGVYWNGSAPECHPVNCGRPPETSNGFVQRSVNYTYLEVAEYTCDRGFITSDVTYLTCDDKGEWRPRNPPSCRPIDCGTPPTPNFHRGARNSFTYSGTTYGHNATYTCGEGFEEDGDRVLTCLHTGLWSANPPHCTRVPCDALEPAPEANVVIESFTGADYGKKVRFNCKQGYVTDDHLELECLATGEWSHDIPSCTRIDCGQLYPIPNGNIEVESTVFESVATYKCDAGFQISAGGSSRRVCEASGAWRGQEPTCEASVSCLPGLCLNGGECTNSRDGYVCLCKKGFGGKRCQRNVFCEEIPCWHGGTCYITDDYYVCKCKIGYTGDHCQEVDGSGCISAPCRNNGTCIPGGTTTYTCNCTEDYTGTNCETDLLESVDENKGAGQSGGSNNAEGSTGSNTGSGLSWWWILLILFLICDVIGLVILVLVMQRKKSRQIQEIVVEKRSTVRNKPHDGSGAADGAEKRKLSLGTIETGITKSTGVTAETELTAETGVTTETGASRFTASTLESGNTASTLGSGMTEDSVGSSLGSGESDTGTIVSGEFNAFKQQASKENISGQIQIDQSSADMGSHI